MSAERRLTDQDYEALSAYLDGELSDSERAALEARLQKEANLRRELEALRQTISLIRQLPPLQAPRNFTLDKSQTWPTARRLLIFPTTAAFSAVSAAAAVLLIVLAGAILFQQNLPAASPTLNTIASQEQTVQSIALAPTATRETDETIERNAVQPTQPPTISPTGTATAIPQTAGGLISATEGLRAGETNDQLSAAPTGAPVPLAAQGGAGTTELQQAAPAGTPLPPENPAASLYAAPVTPTVPPSAEIAADSAATTRSIPQAAATLSEEYVSEEAAVTATPPLALPTSTLSPTATTAVVPTPEQQITKQPAGDSRDILAGAAFIVGVALLAISAATTLARRRGR